MNRKNKIIIAISCVLTLSIIGISYAYFQSSTFGNESSTTISSTSGSMTMTFADSSNTISSGLLLPSDTEFATKVFTITGNNTSTDNLQYALNLVVETNTFSNNALKYSLTGINTAANGGVVANKTNIGISTGESTTKIGSGYFIGTGTGKVHTYTIKFYFPNVDADQSADMNATFTGYIGIASEKYTAGV